MASNPSSLREDLLTLPAAHRATLTPYLPPTSVSPPSNSASPQTASLASTGVHLTLTYAASLDSHISLTPGIYTALSGPEAMAMTQFLRSRHDAILIGVGAAVADDPGLNCRFTYGEEERGGEGPEVTQVKQPVPVILDLNGRWNPGVTYEDERKVIKLARAGKGKGVMWIVGDDVVPRLDLRRLRTVTDTGGRIVGTPYSYELKPPDGQGVNWALVLKCLANHGIKSVMVEGGAKVIQDLLREENQRFVSSVVVTVAPVWLGAGGVVIAPSKREVGREVGRLEGVKWIPMGDDVVMAGKFRADSR